MRRLGLFFLLLLSACSSSTVGDNGKIKIVATTSIVADVVGVVGGEAIDLTALLPPGTDPHSFEPAPQDIVAVAEAEVIFINGVGLETFLSGLLENAGGAGRVVSVSEGIDLFELGDQEEGDFDPHVWFDPLNLLVWVDTIANHLSELDPENASLYAANAEAYKEELRALDEWITAQVADLSEDARKLVSDHDTWGYFANRYGFEIVGAVIPGYSSLAEPSAQELAALMDTIQSLGARAVFVGNTVNANLAERVAEDTGTALVFVYTGSLSAPDGPAATYLEMMRYNVAAIVGALE